MVDSSASAAYPNKLVFTGARETKSYAELEENGNVLILPVAISSSYDSPCDSDSRFNKVTSLVMTRTETPSLTAS